MVRMNKNEVDLLDSEVKRLGKLCRHIGPMTRSTVIRLALREFAVAKKEHPITDREGPCRDSIAHWESEWVAALEDLNNLDDE